MIILKRCRWHITTYMYIIYAAYFPGSSFITLEKTSRYINLSPAVWKRCKTYYFTHFNT